MTASAVAIEGLERDEAESGSARIVGEVVDDDRGAVAMAVRGARDGRARRGMVAVMRGPDGGWRSGGGWSAPDRPRAVDEAAVWLCSGSMGVGTW